MLGDLPFRIFFAGFAPGRARDHPVMDIAPNKARARSLSLSLSLSLLSPSLASGDLVRTSHGCLRVTTGGADVTLGMVSKFDPKELSGFADPDCDSSDFAPKLGSQKGGAGDQLGLWSLEGVLSPLSR